MLLSLLLFSVVLMSLLSVHCCVAVAASALCCVALRVGTTVYVCTEETIRRAAGIKLDTSVLSVYCITCVS